MQAERPVVSAFQASGYSHVAEQGVARAQCAWKKLVGDSSSTAATPEALQRGLERKWGEVTTAAAKDGRRLPLAAIPGDDDPPQFLADGRRADVLNTMFLRLAGSRLPAMRMLANNPVRVHQQKVCFINCIVWLLASLVDVRTLVKRLAEHSSDMGWQGLSKALVAVTQKWQGQQKVSLNQIPGVRDFFNTLQGGVSDTEAGGTGSATEQLVLLLNSLRQACIEHGLLDAFERIFGSLQSVEAKCCGQPRFGSPNAASVPMLALRNPPPQPDPQLQPQPQHPSRRRSPRAPARAAAPPPPQVQKTADNTTRWEARAKPERIAAALVAAATQLCGQLVHCHSCKRPADLATPVLLGSVLLVQVEREYDGGAMVPQLPLEWPRVLALTGGEQYELHGTGGAACSCQCLTTLLAGSHASRGRALHLRAGVRKGDGHKLLRRHGPGACARLHSANLRKRQDCCQRLCPESIRGRHCRVHQTQGEEGAAN